MSGIEQRYTGSGYCTDFRPNKSCDFECERCIYNKSKNELKEIMRIIGKVK
jgi:hypothetical protein